jgi:FlaA1/EpsC-like NDP-sugar epimerase
VTNPNLGSRWHLARWAVLGADFLSLNAGLTLAAAARYDGALGSINMKGLLLESVLGMLTFAMASAALRLHQGRYATGSADESKALSLAVASVAVLLLGVDLASGRPRLLPLTVPVLGASLAFLLMLGFRLAIRSQREGAIRPRTGQPTLVFGTGDAGTQLLRSMLGDPQSPYLPVGLLDDDPTKQHVRIRGVRMLGGRTRIAAAVQSTHAEVLVIALPSAESALVRDISQRAHAAGVAVKVLPTLAELLSRRVGIRDVRDINIADLLGRRQIDTNVAEIAGYVRGKRVLVTGAGGSIGSELCAQIATYHPAELMMLDRDESALHALQLAVRGEARLDLPEVILADIRDTESISQLFAKRRPDVVFHAAALKHLNMLEQYPDEAWKTNVLGTRNVLEAATSIAVSHFVNISTDKAADPVSVLGWTKRTAERLTATYARRNSGSFLSVRFGNVLASRGSVLETFAAQIERGGPVTVTDPQVTRYFMTIPEAVQLVIQAAAIGESGEVLVLDMGAPVRIADVAAHLIALSDQPIPIVFTGLRPGEKLHEQLFGQGESDNRSVRPMISRVAVPPLDGDLLVRLGPVDVPGGAPQTLPEQNRKMVSP